MPKSIAEVAQLTAAPLSREALIRGHLRDAGVSQAVIAERTGASESMVSRVVRCLSRSSDGKIEQAVADAIGQPVEAVFPPRDVAAAAYRPAGPRVGRPTWWPGRVGPLEDSWGTG